MHWRLSALYLDRKLYWKPERSLLCSFQHTLRTAVLMAAIRVELQEITCLSFRTCIQATDACCPLQSMLDKTHSVLQSLVEAESAEGERSSGDHDVLLDKHAPSLNRCLVYSCGWL